MSRTRILAPNGNYLAYVTYGSRRGCLPTSHLRSLILTQPHTSPPIFGPDVLAVVALATGVTVHAPTSSPGDQIGNPTWSPGGRGSPPSIKVTPSSSPSQTYPTQPDLAYAVSLRGPRGCNYGPGGSFKASSTVATTPAPWSRRPTWSHGQTLVLG